MSSVYQKQSYTLEGETTITDPAPLAAGHSEADADAIVALSAAYAPGSKIAWQAKETGVRYITITLAPVTAFVEPYRVNYQWGDGNSETADPGDLIQGHQYARNGAYDVTVTIEQPARPSVDVTVPVIVDGTIDA